MIKESRIARREEKKREAKKREQRKEEQRKDRARNDFSLFEIDTDLCKERQKDNKIHGRYNL
ncbi:hypothetical protein AGMMS49593_07850 [Endomicrobiia bacterium]|nr:hypothetical protein AGMMS49593_07850 [Endomicrobiia bacterium]